MNTPVNMTRYGDWSDVGRVVLDADVSLLVVTRAPGRVDAWNVLAVGYGDYGPKPRSTLEVDSQRIDLSKMGSYRFRVKLENFTGTIRVLKDKTTGDEEELASPRIVPCYVDRGRQCFVHLNGSAARVVLYNASRVVGGFLDLYPYYVFGDLDGNGYPELVFVTQDFTTGSSSSVNDRHPTRGTSVTDSFVSPARVVFTLGGPINSTRYAVAVVSVRFFFWDSSEDDVSDNDNRVILRVGIYDRLRGRYVYSVSLSYHELCRYRTVKPMTVSYVVKDFLLYIPPPEEVGPGELYVALEVVDPFGLEGTRNDAELIVGIEYVGLVLGVRL